ncbi:hypothetical protein HPULCUR_004686 [Helicostylum pulchrum]|uniref:Uncharacterized protein n=1 Tax=Helicostylum pulchrum TaxID=562976 RepID=A0ABP9XWW4_9FUNG
MFSKTKVENILGLGLNALNLSLYLMTMAASVMKAVMEYRDNNFDNAAARLRKSMIEIPQHSKLNPV